MRNAESILMRVRNEMTVPRWRDMSTETLNRWAEILVKLESRIEAFTEEEKKIQADRFTSDEGKRNKLIAAGTQTVDGCAWLARVLQALDDSIQEFRYTYFAVPPAEDDTVLHFLRLREAGVWKIQLGLLEMNNPCDDKYECVENDLCAAI